jgi:leucyl/phenylalanyl-tRNA--protein transferase
MVYRLPEHNFGIFPPPAHAEPNGLIAVSNDLHPERLLHGYANGVFPWFEEDGNFFWFTPEPRMVLFPDELRVHKSMRSIFNQQKLRVTLDTCFEEVMQGCAQTPRYDGDTNTWITDSFFDAYTHLHHQGYAHSVEVWAGDTLVGGLYGLSLGKIFFGESMFAQVANASKTGFITLVRALERADFWLVDCQTHTPHLASLGARDIQRADFYDFLAKNAQEPSLVGRWNFSETSGIET